MRHVEMAAIAIAGGAGLFFGRSIIAADIPTAPPPDSATSVAHQGVVVPHPLPPPNSLPLLSDREIICAVGKAEGTRDANCEPTAAYWGHTDPGNRKHNLGSFSYQHGASTPEEADAKWLPQLRKAEQEMQSEAVAKWGQPLSRAALIAAIDLYNQSPRAAGDFVRLLESPDPTPQQVIDARTAAYIDPETQRLQAPGFGNSWSRLGADQKRRVEALLKTLR